MSEIEKSAKDFIGYEYKELNENTAQFSLYLDCYQNFGWQIDEQLPVKPKGKQSVVRMKRDRKIMNKAELTRLERNFEACVNEIAELEKSKSAGARLGAITVGIIGTAFMAGSTFAVTHEPPMILLCILLAVPGFLGWILPYFLYKLVKKRKIKKIAPLIEKKYDEIYEICRKGNTLLSA